MRGVLKTIVLAAYVVAGCATPRPPSNADAPAALPAPGGAHEIGTLVRRWVDATRTNAALDDTRPREITAQLFFPLARGGGDFAPYLVEPGLADALIADDYWNLPPDVARAWAIQRTHARVADADAGMARRPLIVFAPGYGLARSTYTAYAEALASRGFVVALLDSPYLGFTVDSAGRALSFTALDATEDDAPAQVAAIARDAAFVLDRILADRALSALIDSDRVGMAGHSLGGAAALQACNEIARLLACANLDGWPFGAIAETGLAKPSLIILGKPTPADMPLGPPGQNLRAMWIVIADKSPAPTRLAFLSGVTHLTFSDFPFVLPPDVWAEQGQTLDADRAHAIIVDALTSFFTDALETEAALRASVDEALAVEDLGG